MVQERDIAAQGADFVFRSYSEADYGICLEFFDANCPEYFEPGERGGYEVFLRSKPRDYEVCCLDGNPVGAFGVRRENHGVQRLNWILIDPKLQGKGIGLEIMNRVMHIGRAGTLQSMNIAASHKSAPFFAKFGAKAVLFTRDGWGLGMHRVDMVLPL